jgi:ABC-type multidrug transport system permease subunit
VTNDLKSVVIPSAKVSKLLWRNFGMMAVAVIVLYVAAFLILRVLGINKKILAGM